MRRIRVLIDALPYDSATARAMSGVTGPLAEWSMTDALIGRLIDELAALRWQYEVVNTDERKRSSLRDPPTSVLPRIERKPEEVPVIHPSQLGQFLTGELESEAEPRGE